MLGRIARCNKQEDTQDRVNGDDHLQIFRPSAGPGPPRLPEDRKWVKAKSSNDTYDAECEFEVIEALDFSHGSLLEAGSRPVGTLERSGNCVTSGQALYV